MGIVYDSVVISFIFNTIRKIVDGNGCKLSK